MNRSSEASAAIPKPGEVLDGKYRIERTIGLGAMAVVLEATHLHLHDRVAIKVLLPQWAENPELVERFMREGRAATRIRSEHVVRVFDVGVIEAHPYLVMEYLDGTDLDQMLAHGGPLPVGTAVEYLLQACEAIAEAHALGIVHRDLKPANLFLTRRADGSACVKVLDFGISKATLSADQDTRATLPTTVLGSPQYMSPEQMQASRNVDVRSDVWSLGAMLHELLVVSSPFDGETIAALSAAILRDPAPHLTALRADVPPGVEAVVLRCLEKDPERRFANVAELAAALAEGGSPSARASAERIARVLDGGTGKLSVPLALPPEQGAAKSAVAALGPPPRRVFGYVVGVVGLVGVLAGMVWMFAKHDGTSGEGGGADRNGSEDAMPSPALATSSGQAADAGAGSTDNAIPGTTAPPAADAQRPREDAGPPALSTPAVRPARHPRAPRRAPRAQPPSSQPLPDFPVPSADPNEGSPRTPPSPPALPPLAPDPSAAHS